MLSSGVVSQVMLDAPAIRPPRPVSSSTHRELWRERRRVFDARTGA